MDRTKKFSMDKHLLNGCSYAALYQPSLNTCESNGPVLFDVSIHHPGRPPWSGLIVSMATELAMPDLMQQRIHSSLSLDIADQSILVVQ